MNLLAFLDDMSAMATELENLRAFKRRILEIVEHAENHPDEECPTCRRKREARTENHG